MKKQRRLAKKLAHELARNAAAARSTTHAAPTRGDAPMSRGELYAYFKRIGKLHLYFRMFPEG